MEILKILTRVYTGDIKVTLEFYEKLTGKTTELRFRYDQVGLELAQVGDFLILAGTESALAPFRETVLTVLVRNLDEARSLLTGLNSQIIRDIREVPTGRNMTLRHPDGLIVEYIEHNRPYPLAGT